MGFSESTIKKGKLVTKIFFTIILNEEILKSWEKWYLLTIKKLIYIKQLQEMKNELDGF